MATAVLTINRSKKDKSNTVPVYLKVRHGGKEASWFTGFRVPEKDWNTKGHNVRKTYFDHYEINTRLSEIKQSAQSAINRLVSHGKEPKPHNVIDAIRSPSHSKEKSFLDFYDLELNRYEREGSFNSVASYGVARRHFEEFLELECNGIKPSFEDLTLDLLTRFRTHLISERSNSETTIHKKLSALRTVYRTAQKRGFAPKDQNPFEYLEMKKDTADKPSLSMNEIKQLAELELPLESLSISRDMFLFSFYGGGLRVSDALRLRRKHVVRSGDNWRLVFRAKKTGKAPYQATLSRVALGILERYGFAEKDSQERLFPLVDPDVMEGTRREHRTLRSCTALYNKRLIQIGGKAGLPIRLTSHVARHSAVRALHEKGATVPEIQKVVGHSQLRSTEVYLKSLPDAHVDAIMLDLGA